MKITEQERKLIIRRSAGAISQIQEGEDAISVLSGIYCQNLTEKSPRQVFLDRPVSEGAG